MAMTKSEKEMAKREAPERKKPHLEILNFFTEAERAVLTSKEVRILTASDEEIERMTPADRKLRDIMIDRERRKGPKQEPIPEGMVEAAERVAFSLNTLEGMTAEVTRGEKALLQQAMAIEELRQDAAVKAKSLESLGAKKINGKWYVKG